MTGTETRLGPPDVPVLLPLVWFAEAQELDCADRPPALAFTPQTLAPALPALTGALRSEPPVCPPVPALLPCVVWAQPLVWLLRPPTLALIPQTLAVGFAALTGADTLDPLP